MHGKREGSKGSWEGGTEDGDVLISHFLPTHQHSRSSISIPYRFTDDVFKKQRYHAARFIKRTGDEWSLDIWHCKFFYPQRVSEGYFKRLENVPFFASATRYLKRHSFNRLGKMGGEGGITVWEGRDRIVRNFYFNPTEHQRPRDFQGLIKNLLFFTCTLQLFS